MVRIKRARSWKQPIQPSSNLHYAAPVSDPTLSIMLSDVGFKDIKMLKAYDHNKQPSKNDEVVIYECRK